MLSIMLLITMKRATAQFKPVDQGSSLQFSVANFGFDVPGSFTGLKGSIAFNPQELAASSFDVTVEANTVNTNNAMRDAHLKEKDYFDVKNYPEIHFVSTKIVSKGSAYLVTGKLTIKKQTKEISFPFTATPASDGYLFKGAFKINRKDFDVGGTSTISNSLEVLLTIMAKKEQQ